jgi:hypothetical protein
MNVWVTRVAPSVRWREWRRSPPGGVADLARRNQG